MTTNSQHHRVFVKPSLNLCNGEHTSPRTTETLQAAQPHLVGYVTRLGVSDHDTDALMAQFDTLVTVPPRRMLMTLPQCNYYASLRKLLSVVACAAHIADHINTYAITYQLPIPHALKRASLRHCNHAMLQEAAPDLSGMSPDNLDARAIGIVRRVAEESLMWYHGYDQTDVWTDVTLLDYLADVYRAAGLQPT